MAKFTKDLSFSLNKVFQEDKPKSHSEAIEKIAKELDLDTHDVEHLVRYYLTRVLSKIMLEKKSIYIEKFGKLTYGSLTPKKQKKIFDLKNKPKKVIIRL